jgi:hypothetical protein
MGRLLRTPRLADDPMVGTKWWALGLLGLVGLLSGCLAVPLGEEDEGGADGSECTDDADCRSGACGLHSRVCAHSMCDCPGDSCDAMGEKSADCADGWVCAYYESFIGDVGEFFGAERDLDGGYCQPLCEGGCPEHYSCVDGRFCRIDDHWAYPTATVRWSGGAQGTTSGRSGMATAMLERGGSVRLSASATSPIDAEIVSFAWTIVDAGGTRAPMEGTDIELSLPLESSFMRAELLVQDDASRGATIDLSFEGCSGSGQPCGYQGSGCCKSCDDATKICL